MSWARRILTVATLAGLLVLGWWNFFPNEEKRIRKLLDGVAATVSVPANPSPAATILALDRLKGYFSRDIVVEVDAPGEGRHAFSDREEVMQAAQLAWGNLRNLRVEFLDVSVTVGGAKEDATAELTARARQSGDRDFFFQELKLQLRKQDGAWRITRVETARVLKR